jgi:hypothetical protein
MHNLFHYFNFTDFFPNNKNNKGRIPYNNTKWQLNIVRVKSCDAHQQLSICIQNLISHPKIQNRNLRAATLTPQSLMYIIKYNQPTTFVYKNTCFGKMYLNACMHIDIKVSSLLYISVAPSRLLTTLKPLLIRYLLNTIYLDDDVR